MQHEIVGQLENAIELLEQQNGLDQVAEPLSEAVQDVYKQAGPAGQVVKNAVHGTWLGHPLHPVLTDIPIGAWMTAAVLDATDTRAGDRGYRRAADVAIGFGLVGAVGAAISGLTDWSETSGGPKRLGLVHGVANIVATTLYATSLVLRRSGRRRAGRAFSTAGLLLSGGAAYLGGTLVARDRIGVSHADEGGPETFTRVLESADLAEGDTHEADAAGTAVVLVRQHHRACALAQHCSHLGGPMSEGTLNDGSLVCPWHGSEFRLADGGVINGPATVPQPVFDVRERDGAIGVRKK